MNITKLTEEYISERPSIKDCLKKKLINYSSLSRKIGNELGIKQHDAILIACRRYHGKLKAEASNEEKILEVIRKSKIEVKNKRIAMVLEKETHHDDLLEAEKEVKKRRETMQLIEGATAITIITSQEFLDSFKSRFKGHIIKVNSDLVEINIKSPREIENIPGVLPQLCSIFSEKGVNLVENMSCWTDTLFLIHENDFPKVMGSLKF
jgi:hypothetical protein